jgi:protein-glutamine gamma-glutamyltransferase
MRSRLVATLPMFVVLATFAAASEAWVASAVLAIGAVVSVVFAARVPAGKLAQRITLLLVVIFVSTSGETLLDRPALAGNQILHPIWGTVALVLLGLALVRRAFAAPEGGARGDFVLLAIALAASGERRVGHAYTVVVVVFLVTALAATRADGDPGLGFRRLEAHAPFRLGVLLALTAAGAAAALLLLPVLQELTQRRIEQLVFADRARSGFTGAVRVGIHPRILESDEIVMRVYGPHTDYLRGAVFDQFDGATWRLARGPRPRAVTTLRGRVEGPQVNELRMIGDGTDRDRGLRYFVPLGARHVGTERGGALADPMGTLRPLAGAPPTPLFFEVGTGLGELEIAPPGAQDLDVPPPLAAALERLVRAWTEGATTPRAKLARIEATLNRDYQYSLDADPPDGKHSREPVILRFLLQGKKGHCEYFATAMVLLARSAGIPARVVAGYRVVETNAVGGYDVVRERNAHAWVEAWVDGAGWQTFEPTPASPASEARRSPTAGALLDLVAATWDRMLEALGRARLRDLLTVLAGFVVLFALVRAARAWRERGRVALPSPFASEPPLPCLERLERALASRGAARAPSESLEGWAARLRATEFADVAAPLADYCALRYGGVGDARGVTEALDACAARVVGTRVRTSRTAVR